jgi:hypothetical protein
MLVFWTMNVPARRPRLNSVNSPPSRMNSATKRPAYVSGSPAERMGARESPRISPTGVMYAPSAVRAT